MTQYEAQVSIDDGHVEEESQVSLQGSEFRGSAGDSVDGSFSHLELDLESICGNATNASDITAFSSSHAKDSVNQGDESGTNNSLVNDLDKVERVRKKKQDLNKGRLLARRGIFSAHELTDETLFSAGKKLPDRQGSKRLHSFDSHTRDFNDIGNQERHCILRLPEHVAAIVKKRIEDNVDIGVSIEPTGRYDYREYRIMVNGVQEPLVGILGELPCILEAHKTLDCDLLFKSADVSQMMIAYDQAMAEQVAEHLKEHKLWEWSDGLTPATRNIRTRKFKNFEVYTNEDIKEAEREALILLNGLIRDSYHFEVKSAQEVLELVESYRNGNIKERIIGPDEDVNEYIAALEEQEGDGDLSEVMFSGVAIPFKSDDRMPLYN